MTEEILSFFISTFPKSYNAIPTTHHPSTSPNNPPNNSNSW